jgi:transcription initiation factor TFIIIB Brf1 subunit/transcription initiation factor TFIIB
MIMSQNSYLDFCKICRGRIVSVDYELVCSKCGATYGELSSSFHQVYDLKSAELPEGLRLGSFMGSRYNHEPSSNLSFSASTYSYMKITSDLNDLGKTYRSLEYVSSIIDRVSSKMMLPKRISNVSKYIAYRMLSHTVHERGTLPALAAYSIVVACRNSGLPHSWKSIRECMSILGYNIRLRHLVKVSINAEEKTKVGPEIYLHLFIKKLVNEEKIMERIKNRGIKADGYYTALLQESKHICKAIGYDAIEGYSPLAVAATCVYLAESYLAKIGNRKKLFRQQEYCDMLKISKFTIREQGVKFRKILRQKNEAG